MKYPYRYRYWRVKSSGMCVCSVVNIPGRRKSNCLDWDVLLIPGISSRCFSAAHKSCSVLIYFPMSPLAPVLPGAYYPSGYNQGHSYMHQTSMHSLRSMQLQTHPGTMVRRCFTCLKQRRLSRASRQTKEQCFFLNYFFSSGWFGKGLYLLSFWHQCYQDSNQNNISYMLT